jgi:hypothetical protein
MEVRSDVIGSGVLTAVVNEEFYLLGYTAV